MRIRTLVVLALVALVVTPVFAEDAPRAPAKPKAGSEAKAPVPTLPPKAIEALRWRSIGPANMGGRITALAIYEKKPTTWWAATASGGLLKTTNGGITFEHQFDREAVVSIGDVAVCQTDPNLLWIGTGECNPRNSVSWGDGVYKSTDGGKSWKHMGLQRSFQISSVRIHPENPDIVYVGALGRLWGPNAQRGLFKTIDGGKTWSKIHFVDDKTGVIDVQMSPADPDTLLVATYERQRDMFCTNDPATKWGAGSALYRTTDGGTTFTRVTKGLPTCKLGRIGIDFWRKDPKHVFMVLESEKIGLEPPNAAFMGVNGQDADVGARLTSVTKKGPSDKAGLRKDDIVVAVDGKTIHSWKEMIKILRKHVAGDKITLEISRDRKGMEIELELGTRTKPKQAANQPNRMGVRAPRSPFGAFLGGQQPDLQDDQGKDGHEYGGIYHSEDGGESWARINSLNPRPMYFSEIRVDPSDRARLWVLGIRLWTSKDGGKTFKPDGHGRGVHVDHHALWIDPSDGQHVILGNDGGMYESFDGGKNYDHFNHVAIGQFYDVGVGPRRDYRVYGGLQDNGSWGGPSRVAHGSGPRNEDWIRVGSGDGFRVRVDPEDPDQIYFESQNGNVGRRHLVKGSRGSLRPRPPKGTRYRWNWYTPFILSNHNSRIVYVAGNRVFRSLDRGKGMRAISPDIAATKRGSATSLAESHFDSSVLYVGTDDGGFWMTKNGGHTWTDLYAAPEAPRPEEKPEAKPGPIAEQSDGDADADAKESDATPPKAKAKVKKNAKSKKQAKPKGPSLREAQPDRRYVSWIEPSRHKAGRVYAVFDAHRSDDDRALVFASEDEGASWTSIAATLPAAAGTTRVLREDLRNPNVLYLGTEFGAYVTIDRGASWTSLKTNLPTVAVHQFAQHPTSGEIVAGTHGRSLWVLDVTTLRQMSKDTLAADMHLYRPNAAVQWRPSLSRGRTRSFVGENPPTGARIHYSLAKKAAKVEIRILEPDGTEIQTLEGKGDAGMHEVVWNLRAKPAPRRRFGRRMGAGTYKVQLVVGNTTKEQPLVIEEDPTSPDAGWMTYQDEADEAAAAKAKAKRARHLPQSEGRDE